MQMYSLGSGSSGNAFLVRTARTALLIDCGVAARACTAALKELTPDCRVDAILISHEHVDHVRALIPVLRRTECNVVTTRGTRAQLRLDCGYTEVVSGGRFTSGDIDVTFIGVAHDAAEPCGFILESAGTTAAIFTDLGHVSAAVLDALRAADVIVLESNYDPGMLRRGRYPQHLKRRITGSHGHLSNDDCASALAATAGRASAIWLAHLSENNNLPEIAQEAVGTALRVNGLSTPATPLPRFARQDLNQPPAIVSQGRLVF